MTFLVFGHREEKTKLDVSEVSVIGKYELKEWSIGIFDKELGIFLNSSFCSSVLLNSLFPTSFDTRPF